MVRNTFTCKLNCVPKLENILCCRWFAFFKNSNFICGEANVIQSHYNNVLFKACFFHQEKEGEGFQQKKVSIAGRWPVVNVVKHFWRKSRFPLLLKQQDMTTLDLFNNLKYFCVKPTPLFGVIMQLNSLYLFFWVGEI